MGRTPKVVEDRREQIIDAAMQVFSEKGFTRATNKDIARVAGITPGLIYHYFESKDALLDAIIETRSPLKIVRAIPQQALELPPEQFLRSLLEQVLTLVEEEKFIQIIRLVVSEVVFSPELGQAANGVIQQVLGFLSNYLSAKMESGELRRADAQLTAQIFIGSVIAFILRRRVLGDPQALAYTHAQIIDSVLSTLLQGLLPR